MKLNYLVAFSCLLLLIRCGSSSTDNSLFDIQRSVGTNSNKKLEEASGLVASISNPSCLWTHNDSGNPPELFLLDQKAVTKKIFRLSAGDNRDWEDITSGPGPIEGATYLYIGDIGDNLTKHSVKFIYRIKEPGPDDRETIDEVDTLFVTLSDGVEDSETLLMDPQSRNLYIVTKTSGDAHLYEIAYPFTADTLVAANRATLRLPQVVGGSVSRDGKEVLLKNYESIYYWRKTGNESLVELLKTPPKEIRYDREPQGEAIAWATDGSGFYTLSENGKGERAKLFFYKRK